jgi:hypothetical protein
MTNIITTRLIKYIVAVVGNIVKNTINANYKAIIEVFIVGNKGKWPLFEASCLCEVRCRYMPLRH